MRKIYKYTCPVCGKKFESQEKLKSGCCSNKCATVDMIAMTTKASVGKRLSWKDLTNVTT